MNEQIRLVLNELWKVFSETDVKYDELSERVFNSNKIVCVGAGRVGLVMEAFAKRLAHLGKSAFSYTDSNLPKTNEGDLLIIGSGSGNTKSVLTICRIAAESGLTLALLTANPESEISKISNTICKISCPFKGVVSPELKSIQPMTTLFEQALYLWLDGFVLHYMGRYRISESSMKERHNGLE